MKSLARLFSLLFAIPFLMVRSEASEGDRPGEIGDVLYWESTYVYGLLGTWRPGHCAIYVGKTSGGENATFIHSNNEDYKTSGFYATRSIYEETLNESWLGSIYMGAKTHNPLPTPDQRTEICAYALAKHDLPISYYDGNGQNPKGGYNVPSETFLDLNGYIDADEYYDDNIWIYDHYNEFWCVGFCEAAYEAADLDPTTDETDDIFALYRFTVPMQWNGANVQWSTVESPRVISKFYSHSTDTNILVSFSPDNYSSGAFNGHVTVAGSLSGVHSADLSFNSGTYQLTINPVETFSIGETVTVNLASSIRDLADNPLDGDGDGIGGDDHIFSFQILSQFTLSPTDSFTSSGPAGGPFTPVSKTYNLTNQGGSNLAWTVSEKPSWLDLSSTGSTLSPGGSTTLTATINTMANNFQPGTYTGKISLTSAETTQQLDVSLQVFANTSGIGLSLFDLIPSTAQGANGVRVQHRAVGTSVYTDLSFGQNSGWEPNIEGYLHRWYSPDGGGWKVPYLALINGDEVLAHPSTVTNNSHDRDMVIRVRVSNSTGSVKITGTTGTKASALNSFYIYKGAGSWGSPLWSGGVNSLIDFSVPVQAGEELFFATNAGASDSSDQVFWKNVRILAVPPAIAAPNTTAPGAQSSPGSSITNLIPSLIWQTSSSALGYGVSIRDTGSGAVVYTNDSISTVTSHAIPAGALSNGRNYAWKARARNAYGWSSYGTERFFSTPLNPLPPPSVYVNANEQTSADLTSTSAIIRWSWSGNPANATGIAVAVRNLSTDSIISNTTLGASATNCSLSGLDPATSYRINVAYQPAAGYDDQGSAAFQFTTRFPAPTLTAPSSGATANNPVACAWTGFPGWSMGYRIQFSTTSNGFSARTGWSAPADQATTNSTGYNWTGGVDGQTYWWSVRQAATATSGPGTSYYSTPRSFVFNAPDVPLPSPSISVPSSSLTHHSVTLNWTWAGTPANASNIAVWLWRGSDLADFTTLSPTATGFTFNGLSPSTRYSATVSYNPQAGYLKGSATTDSFYTRANYAPTIGSFQTPAQLADGRVQVEFNASDPESDPITARISLVRNDGIEVPGSDLDKGTIGNAGNTLHFTASELAGMSDLVTGTYRVKVRVFDAEHSSYSTCGQALSPSFSYSVPNTPPEFPSSVMTEDATEDQPFFSQLYANDDGGADELTYSKTSGPSWLSISPGGWVTGTPGNSHVGSNAFVVTATDAAGAIGSATLSVTVANTNDPPVFRGDPLPSAFADKSYVSPVLAFDVDAGDSLTFTKLSGPAWIELSSGGTLSGTPTSSDVGTQSVGVRATDSFGATTDQTVVVNVVVGSTWLNIAGGSWPVSGNWLGDSIGNGTGAIADFSTLDLTNAATVALDGARTIGGLRFGDASPSYDWTLTTGSGGPLTLAVTTGTPSIEVVNQTTTINALLAGTQGLEKSGSGTLILTQANTYTGMTSVTGGTLEVQAKSGDVDYTVNQGATLRLGYNSGGGYTKSLMVNGNGASDAAGLYLKRGITYQTNNGILLQTAPTTIRAYGSGANPVIRGFDVNYAYFIKISAAASGSVVTSEINVATGNYGYKVHTEPGVNTSTGDIVLQGLISGTGGAKTSGEAINSGLHKVGSGSLKLTNANTFAYGTSINAGSVILAGGDNRLPSGGAVALGNGANSGKLVLGDTVAASNQALADLLANGTGTTNAVVGGNSVVSTLTLNIPANGAFSGKIGGTGTYDNNLTLIKTGAGTFSLTGANTYIGDTTVNGGILSLGGSAIADTNKLTVSGGKVELATGVTETIGTLFFGAVQQFRGTWGSSQSTALHKDDTHFSGTGMLIVADGPMDFAAWLAANAPGQTADEDHDHDGVANGIEYFMGITGTDFTTNPGIAPNGTVTWPKSADFTGSYQIQTSTNLSNWTDVTNDPAQVTIHPSSVIWTRPEAPENCFVRLLVLPN